MSIPSESRIKILQKKKIKKEGVDYCDEPQIKEKVKTPPVFVITFIV